MQPVEAPRAIEKYMEDVGKVVEKMFNDAEKLKKLKDSRKCKQAVAQLAPTTQLIC